MSTQTIIANIFGAIAITTWAISVQANKKSNILKLQIIANAFYAIEYYLLNLYSAACMNIVSTVRMILINKKEKERKVITKWFVLIFSAIIIAIGIKTYENYLSLFPIIITLAYTFATCQKNLKVIRIIFLIAAMFWVYYNFLGEAYISLLGNAFEIVSGIISIIRFDIKKQDKRIS